MEEKGASRADRACDRPGLGRRGDRSGILQSTRRLGGLPGRSAGDGLVFEHRAPVVFAVGIGADAARTESSSVDRFAHIAVGLCPAWRCR